MKVLLRRAPPILIITLAVAQLLLTPRSAPAEQADSPNSLRTSLSKQAWGRTPGGEPIDLYSLRNLHGLEARIATYGATIVSLTAPDRDGNLSNVVLGFDSLADYTNRTYLRESPYFGAIIGRYANRINKGRFQLDGTLYSLAINNKPNHLHGGSKGFDKVVWDARTTDGPDPGVQMTYQSEDGEEGYPGALRLTVGYTLTTDALVIDYNATSDRDTIANFTNHSYFNLNGAGEGDILGHDLQLNAEYFTPVDATLIPTGELRPVKSTPFDFLLPTSIGARIDVSSEQLAFGNGYDHNFVLTGDAGTLKFAARLRESTTGRVLEVWTSEPGLQVYTGNFLRGNLASKGKPFVHRGGLCLETQHFPDSPNHPDFPSTMIKAGDVYTSRTVWRFSIAK